MEAHPVPPEYLGEDVPRNAQLMALLLKSMGIDEWEPRVVNQLLEFMYSYTADVLKDSNEYAAHAGRKQIEVSDVRLAIDSKATKCQTPPDRNVCLVRLSTYLQELIKIALRRNQTPIPIPPQRVPGVLLPPEEYCLLKENYQVVPSQVHSCCHCFNVPKGGHS
jgi:transcription initiation factor TFIID subunit 9B